MEKYTAYEWNLMEGGQEVPQREEKFGFIKDLNESKQYRTRQNLAKSNAREIADHAFLDLITLYILYNEFSFAPIAVRYARKTMMYSNFKSYRQSGTDLYQTLHVLQGGNADLIDGGPADNTLLTRIRFPDQQIKQYLMQMQGNRLSPTLARTVLQKAERAFYIETSGYRSVRRLAQSWNKISEQQKALVVTRLLQFYRTHARRSELFTFLQDYARSKKLEIRNANNAEQPMSKTAKSVAAAAALGAAGYAGFQAGRSFGRSLV